MIKEKQFHKINTEIKLYYWQGKFDYNNKNVGDYYGYWLATNLGLNVVRQATPGIQLFLCGSQLGNKNFDTSTIVVGGGFHNSWDTTTLAIENIIGVRGKLSAAKLNNAVKAIGDTGLLATRLIDDEPVEIKYECGLVCHWRDIDFFKEKYKNTNLHIISTYTEDIPEFIRQLKECKIIFSTSLHGIIFAHAAGIPALHLERAVLESKDNFKFKDYYSMLDCNYIKIQYNDDTRFYKLVNEYADYDMYRPSASCLETLQDGIEAALCTALDKVLNTV